MQADPNPTMQAELKSSPRKLAKKQSSVTHGKSASADEETIPGKVINLASLQNHQSLELQRVASSTSSFALATGTQPRFSFTGSSKGKGLHFFRIDLQPSKIQANQQVTA